MWIPSWQRVAATRAQGVRGGVGRASTHRERCLIQMICNEYDFESTEACEMGRSHTRNGSCVKKQTKFARLEFLDVSRRRAKLFLVASHALFSIKPDMTPHRLITL